jgi:hypothetical protein
MSSQRGAVLTDPPTLSCKSLVISGRKAVSADSHHRDSLLLYEASGPDVRSTGREASAVMRLGNTVVGTASKRLRVAEFAEKSAA